MPKITVQSQLANQIRQSDGPIELVDDRGFSLGIVRRPPTQEEIEDAKSKVGSAGPRFTIDELINKIETT